MNTAKPLDSERGQPETQRHEFTPYPHYSAKFFLCSKCELGEEAHEPPHRSEVAPERMLGVTQDWIQEVRKRFQTLPADSGTRTAMALMDELADLVSQYAIRNLTPRDDIAHASAEANRDAWWVPPSDNSAAITTIEAQRDKWQAAIPTAMNHRVAAGYKHYAEAANQLIQLLKEK